MNSLRLTSFILGGSGLLDVIQHADVAQGDVGRVDEQRRRGRQHGEAQEHESAHEVAAVRTIIRKDHDDVFAVELFLGGLEQCDEALSAALG